MCIRDRGWGAEAIGLEGPIPIESYVPMMMFAVLFGLSMDLSLIHISEPTRLLSISYAVFCLKKKINQQNILQTPVRDTLKS